MTTPQRPILGRAGSVLVGLLAVAAALAAGHLVAGMLLEYSASPYLAVGNAAIDRTPKPVMDFAIEVFGTNDKLVLLFGIAVAIALVGIVAGLVSRRQLLPGLVLIVVLGAVGILAVLEQSRETLGVLAPIASLLAGLATFWWLHRLGQRRARTREATPAGQEALQDPPPGTEAAIALARRKFLAGSTGVAAGAAVAGLGGSLLAGRVDVQGSRAAVGDLTPAVPAPPIPPGADFAELGTPTFITPNVTFYRIDINLQVPQLRAQKTTLRITGMVDRELELNFEDIRRRDLVEKTITMTCVLNVVGGHLVSTSNFVGVPLRELLMEAGVRDEATQLVGRASDGFTIGTPLDWVLPPEREALLAIGMNRQPLPPEHGFPIRTVIPGLYGYVSATKWLTELELTTFDFDPYWEQRGWDGDPGRIVRIKTMSRIDTPKGFQQIPAGEITFAGVAWAQTVGIQRVEIRIDQGPWIPAELAIEVNLNTWRMWRARLPLGPGLHTVEVRATDKTGATQTAERVWNPSTQPPTAQRAGTPSDSPSPDQARAQT